MTGRTRIIQAYYWGTPGFLLLDLLLGFNVRVAGFIDRPGARFAYYAFCFVCMGITTWRPRFSSLVGVLESSINLMLLILGILVPIYSLPTTFESGGLEAFPITMQHVLNFLIAGGVCVLSIYRGMWTIHRRVGVI